MNREELDRLMEQIAALGEPPKPPKRPKLMSWGNGVVALFALAAVVGSLGWSYADYNNRQEEWQRIAEEQTALAEQRAAHIAEYDAWKQQVLVHEAEHAAWQQKVVERQKRENERRERMAHRFEAAIAAGKLDEAALQLSAFGDWIVDEQPSAIEQINRFSAMMDRLVDKAREQTQRGESGNDRVP